MVTNISHPTSSGSSNEKDMEVPHVTTYETRKAIRNMPRGKAAGDDIMKVNQIRDANLLGRNQLCFIQDGNGSSELERC